MYFLDALLLLIFATAFSILGQASQVADKCLQGCQSKALLSPENIDCPVDEISPCSCAWTPLMIINLCCLVNSCLLSPDDAIIQWTVDCAQIDVQVPGFSIEIPCPATEKGLSSTWYFIQSREVKYVSVDSTTSTVTKYIEPSPTISQVITPRSSIAVSIGGSTTFNSKPSTNISTLPSPSPTTAIPATAPQNTSNNLETTEGEDEGESQDKDDKKLGLILGLSIPAALILFLAALFFWIQRLEPKQIDAEFCEQEEATSSGINREGLSAIPEEEGGGGSGYGTKQKANRLSELHSDPIPPYSRELPGTPAPQLVELPV